MISMIFAVDPNYLLGKSNDLPWHYPEDMKYFRDTTKGKTVVMGKETFNSILKSNKKPLPNRHNIVVSRSMTDYPGVEVVHDLFAYLKEEHEEEIFIIGGKTIYELAFPYADRLYITDIKHVHEGDVYLKRFDLSAFKKVWEKETDDLIFRTYEKVK